MKNRSLLAIIGSVLFIATLYVGVTQFGPGKRLAKPEGGASAISYVFPGEFDKQQAIWMQWPSEVYNVGSRPVNPAMISIIKAFVPYSKVNLLVRSTAEMGQVRSLLQASGYSGNKVSYCILNHLSIWARDVGPIFVKDNQNKLNVVNFRFNNYSRWASPYYLNIEGQVDKLIAQRLGLNVLDTKLICEGGAIESNGRGTLMATESVVLKRNPGMTKPQIEGEFKRILGVRKVIWLKKGLAEDDTITSGHINEIARFASPNTVLLAQVLASDRYTNWASQSSYLRLEENYKILLSSTDQNGKPFRIIRIPMPPTLYAKAGNTGSIPVRSYINYALTNGAVLFQGYWKPGRSDQLKATEAQVLSTFRSVFPGRKIITIDAENVNLWGGGIHCITQHMPAV